MTTTYKVLGQSAPGATTATTLYTVPSATSAVCSTIAIANRGAANATFRVSIRPGGASQSNEHYLCYDTTVLTKDTLLLTLGITLAATDVVTVYGSTADLSFQLFGSEIT